MYSVLLGSLRKLASLAKRSISLPLHRVGVVLILSIILLCVHLEKYELTMIEECGGKCTWFTESL
jgi:hypothetical protein